MQRAKTRRLNQHQCRYESSHYAILFYVMMVLKESHLKQIYTSQETLRDRIISKILR
jgi:hypothetical protein